MWFRSCPKKSFLHLYNFLFTQIIQQTYFTVHTRITSFSVSKGMRYSSMSRKMLRHWTLMIQMDVINHRQWLLTCKILPISFRNKEKICFHPVIKPSQKVSTTGTPSTKTFTNITMWAVAELPNCSKKNFIINKFPSFSHYMYIELNPPTKQKKPSCPLQNFKKSANIYIYM